MLEINEQNNTAVLISSLDRIFNQGKLNGKLNSIDLYILNLTHNLLDNCCIELTHYQRKALMDLYRKIYFNSEEICHVTNVQKYQIQPTISFTQAETTDCNQYTKFENIYYWQEQTLGKTIDEIALEVSNTGFFNGKLFDTEVKFETGVDCNFNQIGYICLAILDTLPTDTYKIYDYLNNDVTHMFERIYVDQINTILFVSNNIYSHSTTNLKIKKTTDIYYLRTFNNKFSLQFGSNPLTNKKFNNIFSDIFGG